MQVLILGNNDSPLLPIINSVGHNAWVTPDPIKVDFLREKEIEFIVSYQYRHIIKPDVIAYLPKRIINLHISYLPWNRGADPNLWSFLEDTPKGISIHFIDEGIDTGDILFQEEVKFNSPAETLANTYKTLNQKIVELFEANITSIMGRTCKPYKQPKGGSYHKLRDKEPFMHLLSAGWDTPVENLIGKAL